MSINSNLGKVKNGKPTTSRIYIIPNLGKVRMELQLIQTLVSFEWKPDHLSKFIHKLKPWYINGNPTISINLFKNSNLVNYKNGNPTISQNIVNGSRSVPLQHLAEIRASLQSDAANRAENYKKVATGVVPRSWWSERGRSGCVARIGSHKAHQILVWK